MKRIIIVFLALVLVVPLVAQEGDESNTISSKNSIWLLKNYVFKVDLGSIFLKEHCYGKHILGYKLHIINGYRINPHLSAGIGTGLQSYPMRFLDKYYYDKEKKFAVPIFLDFSYRFKNYKISPIISFYAGGLIPKTHNGTRFQETKFFLSANFGLSFVLSKHIALNLSLSYSSPLTLDSCI